MEIILFDHIVNTKYHDKKGLTPLIKDIFIENS